MKNLSVERIGREFLTNTGHTFQVIGYTGSRDVDIKFHCGLVTKTRWDHITTGLVKYPYHKGNCSVGFMGYGKYSSTKHKEAYRCWDKILSRSYRGDCKGYENCKVSEEWHDFQNFAKWFYTQPRATNKDIGGKSFCIDKDILGDGQLYSSSTCCFVPESLNKILTNTKYATGAYKAANKFMVRTRSSGRVGLFDSPEEAHIVYKKTKIKDILKTCSEEGFEDSVIISAMLEKFK